MAKIYTKNTWTDELLAGAERYDIKDNAGAAIETNVQINLTTPVAVAGTEINASRMNNIEAGIDSLDTLSAPGSVMRASGANVQSLTSNKTLTDADYSLQVLTPTAARDVILPAVAATNHPFYIINASGSYALTVKNAGGSTIGTVAVSSSGSFASDGTAWHSFGGGGGGGGVAPDITLALTHAASSKTPPVNADELPLLDSAASFGLKKLTWANLKAALPGAASAGETTTGTETGKYVTPDGLAGSVYGERVISILVTDPNGDALTTGDGKAIIRIPAVMNGYNLVAVAAAVSTVSSSGLPTVQLRNITDSVDMLSTKVSIDANEYDSKDATTAAVIDAAHDDVATGDRIAADVDVAGTGAKGLIIEMTFQLP